MERHCFLLICHNIALRQRINCIKSFHLPTTAFKSEELQKISDYTKRLKLTKHGKSLLRLVIVEIAYYCTFPCFSLFEAANDAENKVI